MQAIFEHTLACPYCGELIAVLIDTSAGSQQYVEDCAVCCRPIEIALEVSTTGAVTIDAATDTD